MGVLEYNLLTFYEIITPFLLMWFLPFFYQLQRYKTVTVRPSYVIFKLFMEAQIKQIYIYILYTVMIMIYIYDHRR